MQAGHRFGHDRRKCLALHNQVPGNSPRISIAREAFIAAMNPFQEPGSTWSTRDGALERAALPLGWVSSL
jgi:hypothetical protein